MSWASWAATLVGAKPVYVYKIEKDASSAFYTSRFVDYSAAPASMPINFFEWEDFFYKIDFFAETFSKRPIAHSPIKETSNSKKKAVTITLPRTDTFAQKFMGPLGISSTRVSIWQGFENDTSAREFVRIFSGEVQLVKPSWGTLSLVCEDAGASIRGKGLAAVLQRPCRHALYHGGCGLVLSDFQTQGQATSQVGRRVTVTEAGAKPDGYYSGGIISYKGSLQLITQHVGAVLTLLGDVGSLSGDIVTGGAQPVAIARGCNRSMLDCDSKFSNSENFGGFQHLTDSPFDGRSMT